MVERIKHLAFSPRHVIDSGKANSQFFCLMLGENTNFTFLGQKVFDPHPHIPTHPQASISLSQWFAGSGWCWGGQGRNTGS